MKPPRKYEFASRHNARQIRYTFVLEISRTHHYCHHHRRYCPAHDSHTQYLECWQVNRLVGCAADKIKYCRFLPSPDVNTPHSTPQWHPRIWWRQRRASYDDVEPLVAIQGNTNRRADADVFISLWLHVSHYCRFRSHHPRRKVWCVRDSVKPKKNIIKVNNWKWWYSNM